MSSTTRIGIIVAVAIVAFGGAFLLFRDDGGSGTDEAAVVDHDDMEMTEMSGDCPTGAVEDSSYAVELPEAPRADSSTFDVIVTHNGAPVTGAVVCFGADMSGMSHPPVNGMAMEMSGGRYQFEAKFSMRGEWQGAVTLATPDGATVEVPVAFDVS